MMIEFNSVEYHDKKRERSSTSPLNPLWIPFALQSKDERLKSLQNLTCRLLIKEQLLKQLTSPVKWTQTGGNMLRDGAESFTEVGPGTVLQGLVKRIAAGKEGILIEGITTL